MAKAKPKKKRSTAAPGGIPIEPISLAELSRRAGVSRAAVTLWVKKQNEEMGGDGLYIDDGPVNPRHPSRKVNAQDSIIMDYINDTYDRGKDRDQYGSAAAGETKSRYVAEKIKQFIRKLEIKNAEILDGYVSRDLTFAYVDTEIKFAKKHMEDYSDLVIKEIAKTLYGKVTKAEKKELETFKKAIDKELLPILEMLDRAVKTMKDKVPVQYEEITESTK